MQRSGIADLPLHSGRVPAWLAERMTRLGAAIVEHIVLDYGVTGFLSRLSDPFWFQALGSVMGMDWHSSGITTAVMGALKRGLNPRSSELGLYVCGGRGRHSRRTPAELRAYAARVSLDGDSLARRSRLVARIDNNAVADGFQLYLHSFVIAATGEWAVVQQGMPQPGMLQSAMPPPGLPGALARRYHWHSLAVRDYTADPHAAIAGRPCGVILNLVDSRAAGARQALLSIAARPVVSTLSEFRRLTLPAHHDVRAADLDLQRLGAVLAVAHERELRDFASLLLVEGLGPRTLQALALIAEVVHGAPARFSDPARFAFALGGKDGHPFPVPLDTYDASLAVLRRALAAARLGHPEKLAGFRRLDRLTRAVEENRQPLADLPAALAHERAISPSLGGRTVPPLRPARRSAQLELF